MTDIVERLRKTASRGVSVWGDLQMEAADELERFQTSLVRLKMQLDQQREYHAAELADVVAEREHLALDLQTERAAVVALNAERDALREDADRYRWLRSQPLDDPEIWIAVDSVSVPGRWALGGDDPDGCDAAIDAARKATP